jgi:transposase
MKAWTGHYTVDIDGGNPEAPGIQVTHTKHLYYERLCPCGHHTCEVPHRSEHEAFWEGVGLTEWRRVGANRCALIVALSFRLRASRRGVREFLSDWLGVALSVGTLQQCIVEAARAAAPVEDQLQAETVNSEWVHSDETPHLERGQSLWLGVFVSATPVLFYVGHRTKEILEDRARRGLCRRADERRIDYLS